jgi:transposase
MSKRKKSKRAKRASRTVALEDLAGILEKTSGLLSEQDQSTLQAAIETLAFLTAELQTKGATIERLRRMLFGAGSEKTSRVMREGQSCRDGGGQKPRAPGHGRNGAAAYRGAQKVEVAHLSLSAGDRCPECPKGKVYPLGEPAVLVRVTGMAPLSATVYELERLRCNLCGQVFTAPPPAGVGAAKYDQTAAAMVGLLKYGAGLPFNRIERLQRAMGIPLPTATAWDLVRQAAGVLLPAHTRLIEEAAQGEVLHNDDTSVKILELCGDRQPDEQEDQEGERTGVFTSAIVARTGGHRVALFFSGRNHAGENLAELLSRRAAELSAPIQMCDALSRNTPAELKTVLANCLAHARRRFVEVANDFPDECRYLLETLRKVYLNDALARDRTMSGEERLRFHQSESGPLMETLEAWLTEQIEQHKVEPNSGLGEAIGYMRKHWSNLTLFLRVAGAPLDNNICERALKKAILHRKNALFYKTLNGARVGDAFMSLIHTAELNGVDPFPYLVGLLRHRQEVEENPGDWMPWNYSATIASLGGLPP